MNIFKKSVKAATTLRRRDCLRFNIISRFELSQAFAVILHTERNFFEMWQRITACILIFQLPRLWVTNLMNKSSLLEKKSGIFLFSKLLVICAQSLKSFLYSHFYTAALWVFTSHKFFPSDKLFSIRHYLNTFYQIIIDQISVKSTFENLKINYLNYTRGISPLSVEMKKTRNFQ